MLGQLTGQNVDNWGGSAEQPSSTLCSAGTTGKGIAAKVLESHHTGYSHDTIEPDRLNAQIRPNAVLALTASARLAGRHVRYCNWRCPSPPWSPVVLDPGDPDI